MFSVNKIFIHFTGEYILRNVSFIINPRDRIGLIGKNGAGKSTLLKIIAGIIKAESGEFTKPAGNTVGYLPQELEVNSHKSVFEEGLSAFSEVLTVKEKIGQLNEEIASAVNYASDAYQKKLEKLHELTEKFNILDGNNIEAETEKVLLGLGFLRSEIHNPMQQFSYGWQMRVELAKILLKKPNLLLLDEPTNHLDIESIQWLEEFLRSYPGAVVLVSHDRALLDNITGRTIEVINQQVYDYKASFSEYISKREERIELQTAAYNNQQREIKQIERFVERFRYKNTKARQVQSRIKMLEKMEKVEIDDKDESAIHFQFPSAPASGKIVIEAENLIKKYGDKLVLDKIDFVALRGEKLAFVGRNGEGKSTFSKIITSHLDYQGKLKMGHNVSIGYYAQNQAEMLDLDKTVFETIDEIALGDIRPKIRNILGSFLFGEEDIDKKVKILSGGEKARLSLAKLLLTPVNLIVLDEPTNHLDMQSKDVLKNALLQYRGTLIIVSHDRDFLEGLTEKVFEFRNRKVKEYRGDIYEFLQQRRIRMLSELNGEQKTGKTKSGKTKSESKRHWEARKEKEKQTRKLDKDIRQAEEQIEQYENKISRLDEIMSNPEENKGSMASGDIYQEYNSLKKKLESGMENWEKLQEERLALDEDQ
ncbi:MAG: ABC-F family ATP-binding cassette domain-containing protein [Bacteroidota bacterium]|nr:ABC-F family ATP-binding cassette domain-containing protein [Bacteroidota bacterium]